MCIPKINMILGAVSNSAYIDILTTMQDSTVISLSSGAVPQL